MAVKNLTKIEAYVVVFPMQLMLGNNRKNASLCLAVIDNRRCLPMEGASVVYIEAIEMILGLGLYILCFYFAVLW